MCVGFLDGLGFRETEERCSWLVEGAHRDGFWGKRAEKEKRVACFIACVKIIRVIRPVHLVVRLGIKDGNGKRLDMSVNLRRLSSSCSLYRRQVCLAEAPVVARVYGLCLTFTSRRPTASLKEGKWPGVCYVGMYVL